MYAVLLVSSLLNGIAPVSAREASLSSGSGIVGGSSTGINAKCPSNCACNDETLTVVCHDVGLNEAPITLNPSMERLILSRNKIKTVDAAAFQFYQALKFVDFSNNHLVKIPPNAFKLQSNLIVLHLNQNRISSLSESTFVGLVSLTVLNLRGNFLEELSDKLFRNLSHLEELDLGQNRLNSIAANTFEGLARLRTLSLDNNQLRAVPTASFGSLNGLAQLRIGLNSFGWLPDDSFKGLNQLERLDVSGCSLANVSDHAFRGLTTLWTLVLADNNLSAVPTRPLAELSRLKELTIGQNKFPTVGKDAFFGLGNLRKLDVSGNKELLSIEGEAFGGNLNVESLIFASNKRLSSIKPGALSGLPNLKELVLRDNGFEDFSENLVAWPELRNADLSDNPITCSCSLLWLRDLLLRRNYSHVLCVYPEFVRGKSLKSLDDDDLGCELYPYAKQTFIGAVCGVALAVVAVLSLLLCRYRHKFCDMFKNYRKKKQTKSSNGFAKQSEYQKTFNDEEFIRSSHHQTLKPVPVTEL